MAHILVIGGAGGVGSAVVRKLLARGEQLSVTVLNAAEETAARFAAPGISAIHHVDLGNAQTAKAQLDAVLADTPAIDGVIVCAAVAPVGPLETTPLDVVRRALEINCVAHIAIYQAVMPALRKTKGRLVFISSMAGKAGMPFIGAYVASKFALEGAADVMRREAAAQGVKVVLVEPGGIKTPMVDAQIKEVGERVGRLDAEEERLYGHLYRAFLTLASAGQGDASSTPDQVADILLTAYDAPNPAARYPAGADAEQLIALGAQGDDVLDAAMAELFGANAPASA